MSEQGLPPEASARPETAPLSGPSPSEHAAGFNWQQERTATAGAGSPSRLLPFAIALAVIPALIVGILVYFVAHKSGGGNGDQKLAASIVDGFLRLGGNGDESSSDNIQSFTNNLPPGYPKGLPEYPGAKLIASFSMNTNQGITYFALYESSDALPKVMSFFSGRLDKDPWQLDAAQNSSSSSGVRFTQPSNPDIEGSISINHSDLDPRSTIYISVQDSSTSAQKATPPAKQFSPQDSLDLPPGFPNDVPIFAGKDKTTVTDTLFQRDSGSTNYSVSFLTKSDQGDVLDFYRNEFQKKGWTVNDSKPSSSTTFSMGIDFQASSNQGVKGTISADKFASDRTFTKVDVDLEVSGNKGKSN